MHPSQNTDLSFDTVRVRLSALRKTAEIAVVYSRSQVENSIRKIQISFSESDFSGARHESKCLVQYAKDLAESTEMFHALKESETRQNFDVVN